MSIPFVHTVTGARSQLGPFVRAMNAGQHGPVILGPRSQPAAVVVRWDLFDELRDRLADLEVAEQVRGLARRVAHPSGTTTAPLSRLLPTDRDQPVTFWPDVVADLRDVDDTDLVDALEAVAHGDLDGEALSILAETWWRFLVVSTCRTDPAHGWHLVWRTEPTIQIVAALPISGTLAAAWQPGPDPETP